jgi:hypothetical protein
MGIWEYGNMGIWEYGNMGIWEYGNMGIWEYGNMGIWEYGATNFVRQRLVCISGRIKYSRRHKISPKSHCSQNELLKSNQQRGISVRIEDWVRHPHQGIRRWWDNGIMGWLDSVIV